MPTLKYPSLIEPGWQRHESKLPADIKPKQAAKALERLGFLPHKQRGSHLRRKHPDGRWTQIPAHPRPIPRGTLAKILREAEIDRQEFLRNL